MKKIWLIIILVFTMTMADSLVSLSNLNDTYTSGITAYAKGARSSGGFKSGGFSSGSSKSSGGGFKSGSFSTPKKNSSQSNTSGNSQSGWGQSQQGRLRMPFFIPLPFGWGGGMHYSPFGGLFQLLILGLIAYAIYLMVRRYRRRK